MTLSDVVDEASLALRPLERSDFLLLERWLSSPHVLDWWGEALSLEAIHTKYEPRLLPDSTTLTFIAELDKQPIGMIQCYRHADHRNWDLSVGIPDAAGIDYLIGESSFTGRGLGTSMIKKMAAIAFNLYGDINQVVSVPQAANAASRKALLKAGFELVKECQLDSDDPTDSGISAIYVLNRRHAEAQ